MIATRLHAKRHSGSALNRPSVISLHNIPTHHPLHQQRHRTSKLSPDTVQNIDSDDNNNNTSEDDDHEIHEGTKVHIFFFIIFQLLTINIILYFI